MQLFKRTPLAVVIAAALFPTFSTMAVASPVVSTSESCPAGAVCETVNKTDGDTGYNGGDIVVSDGHGLVFQASEKEYGSAYFKKNITVSGAGQHAVHIAQGATFKGNLNIEGGQIVSQNDTAIKVDGNFVSGDATNPNMGIYLKNGGIISGAVNAIDFSQSETSMRIDVNGTIDGNIIGNQVAGNKINLAYGGDGTATFDGKRITGMTNISNWGDLTVIAQDDTIVWEGDYDQKKDASLDIRLGDASLDLDAVIYVDGKATFNDNNRVTLSYTGSNVNDLLGRDIVLLEASDGIVNGDKVDVGAGSGFASGIDASPILKMTESWLEQTNPEVNGGVIDGDKLVVSYDINYQGGEDFTLQASQGGASDNEVAFANYVVNHALEQHNQTGSAQSGQLLALLVSAGTSADKTARLADELTPDAEGSEVFAALQAVDKMRANATLRANTLRYASHNGYAPRSWNWWSAAMTSYGSRSGDETRGFDLTTAGINVGIDRVFDNERVLGFSAAYSFGSSDIDGTQNSNDLNQMQTLIYGGWFDERYFINGNINVGTNRISSERSIGLVTQYEGNTKANASYDALQMGYELLAGMTFDLGLVKLEPSLSYNYQWLRLDDYLETGSPASLKYDRTTYARKQLGFGVSAYNTYETQYGKLTPKAALHGHYDMSQDYIRESAVLVSDPSLERMEIIGDKVGGNGVEASLSATLETENQFTVDAAFSYLHDNGYNQATVNLNLSKRF